MAVDESQLYRDLMRLKPDGWTANAWAVQAGVSRTVWTDMRRHGNPSRRTLEKLLKAAGSSLAEFEALRVSDGLRASDPAPSAVADLDRGGWQPASVNPLPLVLSAPAGPWGDAALGIEATELRFGEVGGQLPRPPLLRAKADAYALTVVSNGMWPRFRLGRRIAVSPRERVDVGDDVLVTLSSGAAGRSIGLIGELVGQDPRHVELRQFNPDTVFQVAAGQFSAVHKVVGELI